MKYSDKVKQSKNVLNAIQSLQDGESIEVSYGKNRKGEPETYSIKAYMGYQGEMSYSIWKSFSGMNIDKIGRTTMKAYTYDMMSQRTNWTFNLYDINLIK